MKTLQMFTVRNAEGQFIATYRAASAASAIEAHLRDQRIYNSTFRRRQRKRQVEVVYTASVEEASQ